MTPMKTISAVLMTLAIVAACLIAPGCGNVTLKGAALTAAEVSTGDAYNAAQRWAEDPGLPFAVQAYLDENFIQWRCFVRSARKSDTWGPELPGESGFPIVQPDGSTIPPATSQPATPGG